MLVDSHAHLTGGGFSSEELPSILKNASSAGVHLIVNVCTDKAALEWGLKLKATAPQVHLAAAIPPHDLDKRAELFDLMTHQKELIAVGETGLEYFHQPVDRAGQISLFEAHLQWSVDAALPLIIHCREAFEDFFSIIDHFPLLPIPGVLHCFTGSKKEAEALIDRGWMISLSGIITFKKSVELREVAQWIPLSHLLIETDAPYLAPQTMRGKRNEPSFLKETAECVALVKGVSTEDIATATSENLSRLFHVPLP